MNGKSEMARVASKRNEEDEMTDLIEEMLEELDERDEIIRALAGRCRHLENLLYTIAHNRVHIVETYIRKTTVVRQYFGVRDGKPRGFFRRVFDFFIPKIRVK